MCPWLEALLLMFGMSVCESVTVALVEKRVIEWSRPQSFPSQGVSLKGHE